MQDEQVQEEETNQPADSFAVQPVEVVAVQPADVFPIPIQPAKPVESVAAKPVKSVECFCDGGYSPCAMRGVWCFVVGDSRPVFGFLEDDDSSLSCNIMEYTAVIELLKSLPNNAHAVVHSDSQLIVNQLIRNYNINFAHLQELAEEVWHTIKQKNLKVAFHWVRREDNPVGRYIEKHQQEWFGRKIRYVRD
jgi:ribonuclease HI